MTLISAFANMQIPKCYFEFLSEKEGEKKRSVPEQNKVKLRTQTRAKNRKRNRHKRQIKEKNWRSSIRIYGMKWNEIKYHEAKEEKNVIKRFKMTHFNFVNENY